MHVKEKAALVEEWVQTDEYSSQSALSFYCVTFVLADEPRRQEDIRIGVYLCLCDSETGLTLRQNQPITLLNGNYKYILLFKTLLISVVLTL